MPPSKLSFLKTTCIVIIITAISSCKKNESIEKVNNKYVLTKDSEEIEAYFLIATANVTKSIISKSQLAQHKSLKNTIKEVSAEIENNQNLLLQEINKIAVKKLIIINEINSTAANEGIYELVDKREIRFDNLYINSIIHSLSEQIELFKSISKQTEDMELLNLVTHYLPKQYEFLRETQKIKKEIN
jgi:predicted outer membrane protein